MSERKSTRQFAKDKKRFREQCARDHAPCWICGQPIDYTVAPNATDDSFNLDHLIPVARDPSVQFDPAGFRASHASCNRERGAADPYRPIGQLSRAWAADDLGETADGLG